MITPYPTSFDRDIYRFFDIGAFSFGWQLRRINQDFQRGLNKGVVWKIATCCTKTEKAPFLVIAFN